LGGICAVEEEGQGDFGESELNLKVAGNGQLKTGEAGWWRVQWHGCRLSSTRAKRLLPADRT
jgi:hypothetical protein